MKRRNCVVSIESFDVPKKQRTEWCVPLQPKDLPALPTASPHKQGGKRLACCLESAQSEAQEELEMCPKFSFWKRFKSNIGDPATNEDFRPMCEDAQLLNNTGSNFAPNVEFNCFNYWRVAPVEVEVDDSTISCSQMEQGESPSACPSNAMDDEFNSFNYWRTSLPNIDVLQ